MPGDKLGWIHAGGDWNEYDRDVYLKEVVVDQRRNDGVDFQRITDVFPPGPEQQQAALAEIRKLLEVRYHHQANFKL